jgi:hypothetical protein
MRAVIGRYFGIFLQQSRIEGQNIGAINQRAIIVGSGGVVRVHDGICRIGYEFAEAVRIVERRVCSRPALLLPVPGARKAGIVLPAGGH